MKRCRKSIVSWLMAFTMVFMGCFSSVFATVADMYNVNVNTNNVRTTGSGIQTTGSGLQVNEPSSFKFSGDVYLVGDSTACEYDEETVTSLDRQGWGMRLGDYFTEEVTVHNLALSGRSSRSFITEDYYKKLLNELGEGDYLFIQFAHNDQKITDPARGTVPGLDLSTLDAEGKNSEGTYSFEWVLINKYIEIALERGAMPVLLTPITRRASSGGANYSAHVPYQEAILKVAQEYKIPCIDVMHKTIALYTETFNNGGAQATAALHAMKVDSKTGELVTDNTHLSAKGATLVSGLVVEGIKELGLSLANYIKSQEVQEGITIHLAGDSTVKKYEDTQFIGGWGEFIQNYFDASKVTIRNYAQGGRSSRSFINEGRLIDNGNFTTDMAPVGMGPISESIKAGDYLFIQFGHNDDNSKGYSTMYDRMIPLGEPDENGIYPVTPGVKTTTSKLPAAYLEELDKAGLTDEAKDAAISKALKTIEKYGETYYAYDCGGTYKWFLKQYIDFAREQGATPVLITPVSRRNFDEEGHIKSTAGHHGGSDEYWDFRYVEAVRQLAKEENVILIDLFAQTKALYETLGEKDSAYIQSLKNEKGSTLDGIWVSEYNAYMANGGYGAFDNTHQNKLGAHIFAAKLVEEVLKNADIQKGINGKVESLTDVAKAAYKVPTQYVDVPDCLVNRLADIAATFKMVKPIDEKLLEDNKPNDDKPSNDNNKPSSSSTSKDDKYTGIIPVNKQEAVKNEETKEVTTGQSNFNDLTGCEWALKSINRFASLGFIKGMPNGQFLPKHNISRADFMMIGANVLGLQGEAVASFKDIPANKYYANSIALMEREGLVSGMANNSFNPEGNITRQDAMCIAARMLEKAGKLGESDQAVLNTFKDHNSVSAYAKDSVAALIKLGVISGADNSINPKAYITRAEVCVMLERVYDLLNQ